jgi:NADH-quinone oxidoreductase subunit J
MSGVRIPLSLLNLLNSMIVNLFFYFFSFILIVSALMTILSQNSIYSVLFLVLSFVSSSSILFLLECEYISLIFIIIYVGAIAVLFLFVVMMLDVKTVYLAKDSLKYFPFGSFIGIVFLIEILLIVPSTFESINPYNASFLWNCYFD